ncbi:hypothetical protein [uncultured Bacteroides sp.]|uniref:hypothetical protein n=1 Tax=uncultured Bacteroides sp. TaxID=162156 RepID=UPI002AAAE417|nr:hypothetical protein [uncultured Bacteroides sp.]
MKKVTLIFIVLATLFAMPSLSYAQTPNYTVNLLNHAFEYIQSTKRTIRLKWRLPRDMGDGYEGQTAKEMLLWSIQGCDIQLYSFGTSHADDNNLYGAAELVYVGDHPCTVTVTGLSSFSEDPSTPSTRVFNFIPW